MKKQKLMMLTTIIFASTAIFGGDYNNLPNTFIDELGRAERDAQSYIEDLYSEGKVFWPPYYGHLRHSLDTIEYLNSKNSIRPETVGQISNKEFKKLKNIFFTKLQIFSDQKAKEHTLKYFLSEKSDQATAAVHIHEKLCKLMNEEGDCDYKCKDMKIYLQRLCAEKEKYEQLETLIKAEKKNLKEQKLNVISSQQEIRRLREERDKLKKSMNS